MATRLRNPKEIKRGSSVDKPHAMRYPWEKWFSWVGTTLVRGVDFDCATSGMCYNVRQAARRMGVRVSVTSDEDAGSVTFIVKQDVKPINGKPRGVKQ